MMTADVAQGNIGGGGEPEVSQSLAGLMGAFDKLKDAVGYHHTQDSAEFAAIEHFVHDIESENAELRLHAMEAIEVAERLREENLVVTEELCYLKMKGMVDQTAELNKVAYEYDQEMLQATLQQAEMVLEEVGELRSRVDELEEENAGLTETLNELRQTQQQMYRLQAIGGKTPEEGVGERHVPDETSETMFMTAGGTTTITTTPGAAGMEVSSSSPSARASPSSSAAAAAVASVSTPLPPPSSSSPGADQESPMADEAVLLLTPGSLTVSKDPLAVADALTVVAAGAEGGVAACAARMLRDFASVQASLDDERGANTKLQSEIKELTDLVSTDNFKAPSAWAERELKYRTDKRRWEETLKETDAMVAKMANELEDLRSKSGIQALERRIEELEARLLESERDREVAQTHLHELKIAASINPGEFTLSGVKPYQGSRQTTEGGGVAEADAMPHQPHLHLLGVKVGSTSGLTPRSEKSYRTGGELTPALGLTPRSDKDGAPVEERLAATQRENALLKAKLEKAGISVGTLTTPRLVRHAINNSSKRTKELEGKLTTAQKEREGLLAELEALKVAAAANGSVDQQTVTLQLRITEAEAKTEVSLLKHGVDADSAHILASLEVQLQKSREREAAVIAKLESAKAIEPAAAVEDAQQELEEEVRALREEQQDIQKHMIEVATTASVQQVPATYGATAEVPGHIAGFLAEAASAAAPDAVRSAETQQRIQELQMQLHAAEQALAAMAEGTARVEMRINVVEATPEADAGSTAANGNGVSSVEVASLPATPTDAPPAPVVMPIAVTSSPAEATMVRLDMPIFVSGDTAEAPITVPISLPLDPQKERRIRELEKLLKVALEEEELLRHDLNSMAPFKPSGTAVRSRRSSGGSLEYTAEGIAQDRAEVEAAWQDHVKNTDVPALVRAKVELETQCQMLQGQLDKALAALASADLERLPTPPRPYSRGSTGSLDEQQRSGSTGMLSGLRSSSRVVQGHLKGGVNMFKRKGGKDAKAAQVAAVQEGEIDRLSFRRQIAKLSKKFDRPKGAGALEVTTSGCGISGDGSTPRSTPREMSLTPSGSLGGQEYEDEQVIEVVSLRHENATLMEHLVSTKVRLAEVEGDYLESRRSLLRSREKQIQLARQIIDLQAAVEPMHQEVKIESSTPQDTTTTMRSAKAPKKLIPKLDLKFK